MLQEAAGMAIPPKFIGMPVKQREAPRLITGTSTYVDDLHLPRMASMAILRSPYAARSHRPHRHAGGAP
jgi:CO/xanthine dehydrogenase Mo-binding subunit